MQEPQKEEEQKDEEDSSVLGDLELWQKQLFFLEWQLKQLI